MASPRLGRQHWLSRLARGLVTALLVVATVSALLAVGGAAALRLTGRQVAVVLSGSMTPQFVAGDVVIVRPAPKPEDLRVGEIVTFHAPGEEQLTTHRIHAIIDRPEGRFIQTKGDANDVPDANYTPAANVVGIAGTVIPGAGRWVLLYTDVYWRLLTLGLPLLLVIGYHASVAIRVLLRGRTGASAEAGETTETTETIAIAVPDLAELEELLELEPAVVTASDAPADAEDHDDHDDQDDDDHDDDVDGGTPEVVPARPSADRPPRSLRPARPHPAGHPVRRPVRHNPGHPDGQHLARHAAPRPVREPRPRARLSTIAVSAAAVLGLSVGLTGALFTSSTATAASFSTAKKMCGTTDYVAAVLADNPTIRWPHGSTTADSSGSYSGSVTMPLGGAMTCSDATRFNATGALTQKSRTTEDSTFTIETWFRSSSTAPAQIVGFGERPASQNSTNRDRVLYVDSTGHAAFPYFFGWASLTSSTNIVDGAWHYVAVTYDGGNDLSIYVDGRREASTIWAFGLGTLRGYWRAGTDDVSGLSGGGTGGLTADLSETAIYPTALSAARISAHYTAAR